MPEERNAISITRQLQWVFGISILILLISSTASFYSNRQLIETSKWVNHTNEVMFEAERLISLAKDAETGQRGYIITNDPVFLKPYNGAFEKTLAALERLRELTRDNPAQQKNMVQAKLLVDQRFEQMRRTLALVQRRSMEDRFQPLLQSDGEMTKGRLLMDDLRTLVQQIKAIESSLLEKRLQQQDTYIRFTPPLVIAAAIISLLISIIAYARIKSDLDERVRQQKKEAATYRETVERINALEGITAQIAKGDYAVRSTDEVKDELGRIASALNDMAASLEQSFHELERRNWLQTGTVKLSDAIRGERYVQTVANKIIGGLADYLGAAAGTLYLANQDLELQLAGAYATDNAPEEIRSGKTLTGQALHKRELMVVNDLPPGYLYVSSSLGLTAPVSLVLLPMLHSGEVVAVAELALLHRPEPHELEFLRNNAEALAISLNAALSYERIQALLEETQAQTEELQAQHAELENINTELEMQTERLQASEEELRVQQEELQQANLELEERSRLLEERNLLILDKNIEVQRKAEELEQSTRYKSEFLANMSHELRTPLNSILLLSRLLKENTDHNLSTDQVEYADVIHSSGNGLLALIDEILDLSKIEAGKMQLEYDKVSVGEVLHDMKVLFEPVAKEKQLSLEITVDKEVPPFIETDKLRLEQVLRNLLSNALKFTAQGKVGLRVAPAEDGFIRWIVTDSGIGIAADKQLQIFEAFQQADGSTRRKFGGTGLGLSISKELMKLLQGSLSLESEVGKGSVFTAILPVSQVFHVAPKAPEPQPAGPAALEQQIGQPEPDQYLSAHIPDSVPDDRAAVTAIDKTILIIEDDTHFAGALVRYTRQKGYKAITSVRGDEGIALAREFKPSGILLDIQLPVKSGWDVMEALKSDPATRHIPVHVMSSHSVRKESLMKGAVDFIDKPVAMEQLQEIFRKLEHVLDRSSKKVLIVEENPKHSKALAYFLETFQINSEIRNTVSESVEALKNDADCVILDMGVPDQHAYDMLEEVKKNPGLEHLPIIIFTGKSLSLSEEQRIRQYADSIIVKTAHSYQRILDEVSLFLHLVEEKQPKAGNDFFKRSGAIQDVLRDKTVLVVDDDVRNIFSLSKILEQLNMKVLTAVDGREAMDQLNAGSPVDIVLLDMMMPEMDGYETARAIRQDKRWKSLPVIAVTAKAMTGDREKCINAGASDYITKPVDTDQLVSLLRVWLYEHV